MINVDIRVVVALVLSAVSSLFGAWCSIKGWRARALGSEALLAKSRADVRRLEEEKKVAAANAAPAAGPYRTPEPAPPPAPPKPPVIMPFSSPVTASCPKCGDAWTWAPKNAPKLCSCATYPFDHFHQRCPSSDTHGQTRYGCGAIWIVKAKDAIDDAPASPQATQPTIESTT